MLKIPPDRLSADALRGLIEDYVTRDGTDYGEVELSLEQKAGAALRQLRSGEVVIVYDPGTETTTLVSCEQFQPDCYQGDKQGPDPG